MRPPDNAVREWGGYWAATLGAVVGGVLLVVPGTVIGYQYGQTVPYEPRGGGFLAFGNLSPKLFGSIGLVITLWLGEVLGCRLALRLCNVASAGATAALVGAFLVFIVPIWVITATVLTESLFGSLLSAVVPLTTIPVAARWLVNDYTHTPEEAAS